MEKTGFVYTWYDRKRKMYYIGCHIGTEDDGYICSSNRMRDAYRRRPGDFKRRILKSNIKKQDILKEEHRWLSMIQDHELKIKYYNLSKRHFGHWSIEKNNQTTKQKISNNSKDRTWYHDPETNINHTFKNYETVPENLIKGRSPDYNKKLSKAKAGQKFSENGYKNILQNLEKATLRNMELAQNKEFQKRRGNNISISKYQPITIDGIYYASRKEAIKNLGKRNYFRKMGLRSAYH